MKNMTRALAFSFVAVTAVLGTYTTEPHFAAKVNACEFSTARPAAI